MKVLEWVSVHISKKSDLHLPLTFHSSIMIMINMEKHFKRTYRLQDTEGRPSLTLTFKHIRGSTYKMQKTLTLPGTLRGTHTRSEEISQLQHWEGVFTIYLIQIVSHTVLHSYRMKRRKKEQV